MPSYMPSAETLAGSFPEDIAELDTHAEEYTLLELRCDLWERARGILRSGGAIQFDFEDPGSPEVVQHGVASEWVLHPDEDNLEFRLVAVSDDENGPDVDSKDPARGTMPPNGFTAIELDFKLTKPVAGDSLVGPEGYNRRDPFIIGHVAAFGGGARISENIVSELGRPYVAPTVEVWRPGEINTSDITFADVEMLQSTLRLIAVE